MDAMVVSIKFCRHEIGARGEGTDTLATNVER